MHRLSVAASILAVGLAVGPGRASAQHQHDHGSATSATAPSSTAVPKNAQKVEIQVTKQGFVPATVTVKAGTPVALQVTRKVERTCATEIVMKDFGVNQPLPLDKTVTVVVNPKKAGTYRYSCGMDMIAGELRVQ